MKYMKQPLFSHRPQSTLLPASKFCITIAFNFIWILQSSQEKSKAHIFFWGGGGGGGKQDVLWSMWKWRMEESHLLPWVVVLKK